MKAVRADLVRFSAPVLHLDRIADIEHDHVHCSTRVQIGMPIRTDSASSIFCDSDFRDFIVWGVVPLVRLAAKANQP